MKNATNMKLSETTQRKAIEAITAIIKSGVQEHGRIIWEGRSHGLTDAMTTEMLGRMLRAAMVTSEWRSVGRGVNRHDVCTYGLPATA